jgi:hypothetical protein
MSSKEAMGELKNLREKRNAIAKEITERAKTLFEEASATLFEEYPNLVKFGWSQYTPYFNDGDTCTFSSHHEYPSIVFTSTPKQSEDEDDDYDNDEFSEYHYTDGYGKDKKKKTNLTPDEEAEYATGMAVIEFLKNFEDDDMLSMFGDHQRISVTRKGVESEDYEHD